LFLIVGFFVWGFTKAEVGSDFKCTYGDEVPFIRRVMEISESKIGYFYSYNLTVGFPEPGIAIHPDTLRNLEIFSEQLRALDSTKSVVTILQIVKDMNQLLHGDDPEFYRVPDSEEGIAECLAICEELGTDLNDWVDEDSTTLRLKVAVDEVNEQAMRAAIDFATEDAGRSFPGAETSIVGLLPSMVSLNRHVSIGLIRSFLVALAIIMLLMMIVFRSVKTGLIAMIPNITPVAIIGGAMGHMSCPLDFMTMTMLPMILGLAVDDTIHFITHATWSTVSSATSAAGGGLDVTTRRETQ
jgi:predicted RND superfamily exporter protein